jgi:hypothetical protein
MLKSPKSESEKAPKSETLPSWEDRSMSMNELYETNFFQPQAKGAEAMEG